MLPRRPDLRRSRRRWSPLTTFSVATSTPVDRAACAVRSQSDAEVGDPWRTGVTLDLGGPTVITWAYGDSAPGPLLRARAGDLLKVTVENDIPSQTSIHWHGVALRNDMDGVPGVTQESIPAGGTFTYEFTGPDPGTYFYHPHDLQLDRGLYGVLVVDDPHEPGWPEPLVAPAVPDPLPEEVAAVRPACPGWTATPPSGSPSPAAGEDLVGGAPGAVGPVVEDQDPFMVVPVCRTARPPICEEAQTPLTTRLLTHHAPSGMTCWGTTWSVPHACREVAQPGQLRVRSSAG